MGRLRSAGFDRTKICVQFRGDWFDLGILVVPAEDGEVFVDAAAGSPKPLQSPGEDRLVTENPRGACGRRRLSWSMEQTAAIFMLPPGAR